MKTLTTFTVLLLARSTLPAPTYDDVLTVTSHFFPKIYSIYTADHEIVNLFCPFNSLSNFDDFKELVTPEGVNVHLFFVLADVTDDVTDFKGLYVLKNKKATKLLDNGRDFAAKIDDKTVFIAATDGIYVYNAELNKAEKYGNVTESFIGIAVTNTFDLYALTENHILYKVTEEGTQKEEVSDVKDAVQIVMDFEDNLFFVNTHKNVYVKKSDGEIKKINGLPRNPSVKLLRPPFYQENAVTVEIGNKFFGVHPNGLSDSQNVVLTAQPSAYAVAATRIHYYAYKKGIYEYNMFAIAAIKPVFRTDLTETDAKRTGFKTKILMMEISIIVMNILAKVRNMFNFFQFSNDWYLN